MLQLIPIKAAGGVQKRLQPHRFRYLFGEKLLRGDVQVIADIEKPGHGGSGFAALNIADISG